MIEQLNSINMFRESSDNMKGEVAPTLVTESELEMK